MQRLDEVDSAGVRRELQVACLGHFGSVAAKAKTLSHGPPQRGEWADPLLTYREDSRVPISPIFAPKLSYPGAARHSQRPKWGCHMSFNFTIAGLHRDRKSLLTVAVSNLVPAVLAS